MGQNNSKKEPAMPPCGGAAAERAADASTCPVPEEYRGKQIFDVYSQKLNPRNNMPNLNNEPIAGQKEVISQERQKSTIPKAGTEGTWVYPSPQMFFNALNRKNKGDNIEEGDMQSVVSVHNSMNELSWGEVMRWEALHAERCPYPMLLRFEGRPTDFSPLARIRMMMGREAPFDRHDWYVLRCGEQVRYVIDFYFDDSKAGSMDAFEVVARPALDSVQSCIDRVRMPVYKTCAKLGIPCPLTGQESRFGDEKNSKPPSDDDKTPPK